MAQGVITQFKYSGMVSGLRWAGLKELLFQLACRYGLDYRTVEEDRGLLRTTIYFEVNGPLAGIDDFNGALKASIVHYNRPVK